MRILVVDDNQDAALILSRLLTIAGHQSRSATCGKQALQIAAEFLPEAILLDAGLPTIYGYAVAERLRAMPALRGVRIALVSGQQADAAMQRESGIDCHVLKPAGLVRILAAIGAEPPLTRSPI
jgi:two-component system, OmpR family, response regulator